MADVPDGRGDQSRKVYHKPEVARVDLIEDEVALASCKKAFSSNVVSSGISSTMAICKTSCSSISNT